MNRRRIVSMLVLALTLSTGIFVGRATADQPHMQSALTHLRSARAELDKATADKGGHRGRAIALVNDAIAEVERGMTYDRRH